MVIYEQALTDPDFDKPGSSRGVLSVFGNLYLLKLLIQKGIKTRYYGSALGWIWSYVRPTAQLLMYFIVIGVILQMNRVPFFPVYLFSGLVIINLFTEIFKNTTNAIVDNSSLIKKIYLPRELFPIAAIGVALIHFGPQVLVLLVVALIFGWTFTWIQLFAFLGAILLLIVWALGLGLFFGAVNVTQRDATNIVDLILMFATWISPVLYSSSMVSDRAPDWLYFIYMCNPVTISVELFHFAFWDPISGAATLSNSFFGGALIVAIILSFVSLIIGQIVFSRLEGQFAARL